MVSRSLDNTVEMVQYRRNCFSLTFLRGLERERERESKVNRGICVE